MDALRRAVWRVTSTRLSRFNSSVSQRNHRPIIGVMTQEAASPEPNQNQNHTSYIHANHVKFLESAGARVVPVRINQSVDEYERLFNCINGLLLPGDHVCSTSSAYARSAKIFYELALEANRKHDYFPVCGLCLGLKILCDLTCGKDVFTATETEAVSLPLNLTEDAKGSRMFRGFPDELMKDLSSEPLSQHEHKWSLTLSSFQSNEKLKKFYKVLTTSTDRNVQFVSTLEAYDYPIYATQWHPERSAFDGTMAHFPSAVMTTYHIAEFFVEEARKNFHAFESEDDERKELIYNYPPVYTGPEAGFKQLRYFF